MLELPSQTDREAWSPLVEIIGSRLGMYVRRTFSDACSLMQGFGLGRGDQTLLLWAEWLRVRNSERPELGFPSLVLYETLGTQDRRGPSSLSEDEDLRCVQHLSKLLGEFLGDIEFARAWHEAGCALSDLAAITDMRPDARTIVVSHLEHGSYVAAYGWLARALREKDRTPDQIRLLQTAAISLRQQE